MALACWGSALLNALLSALINYSRVALVPASKKPGWIRKKITLPLGSLEFF
jgi:hypothetical protein